tara:strand:- start:959 stop:1165 length:207 start_codon:yes stop_codon:yes gene_type:complete
LERQRLGEDVIGYAHALKVEALAGLGELLKKQPKETGVDLWDEPTYTRLRGRSRVDRPERIRDRGGRP